MEDLYSLTMEKFVNPNVQVLPSSCLILLKNGWFCYVLFGGSLGLIQLLLSALCDLQYSNITSIFTDLCSWCMCSIFMTQKLWLSAIFCSFLIIVENNILSNFGIKSLPWLMSLKEYISITLVLTLSP